MALRLKLEARGLGRKAGEKRSLCWRMRGVVLGTESNMAGTVVVCKRTVMVKMYPTRLV